MGCCISTPKDDQNTLKNQENTMQEAKVPQPQPVSKSPPLTVEEEIVKEVLSETKTPISKPQKVSILTQETKTQMHNMEITKEPIMNKAFEEPSEVSLLSETCSVGESFSTTTTATTMPESREDEVTSKRRIREGIRNRNRNRNHSDVSRKHSYTVEGNRVGGREQRRHKSPTRVPEIPPEKKLVVNAGSVRRREFPEKFRRDPGESVRRRSRSPSCHRTVGTGSSHYRNELRQIDRGGRQLPPPGKCEEIVGETDDGILMEEIVGETDDGILMEESIMNPHVSLECFIFL